MSSNIHPLFKAALAPFAPPAVGLKPFSVCLTFNGQAHELNTVAFTACDAISRAIDIYFDGDEPMPADLRIEANPLNLLAA